MRLFEVSQKVFFKQNSCSEIFLKGECVELKGFACISEASSYETIYLGYLQNTERANGMTWYTKALHDVHTKKLTMVAATKNCQNFAPSIFCSHIPFFKDSGQGLLDENDGNEAHEKYFFINESYLAKTSLCMREISSEAPEFRKSRRKLERMLNRYHTSHLFMGDTFLRILPHWSGESTIIDAYPRDY